MAAARRGTRTREAAVDAVADVAAATETGDGTGVAEGLADDSPADDEAAENGNGTGATAASSATATTPADTPRQEPTRPATSGRPRSTADEVGRRVPGIGRTYHGARRTWLAVLFLPIFLLVALIEEAREIAYRMRRGNLAERPGYVAFRRPVTMPSGDGRSVAEVVAELQRFPFDPLHKSARLAFYREFAHEGLGVLFHAQPALAALPHLYPGTFKPRLFTGHDGVQLAGLQAMHDAPGPALILCHGLLTNKNFDYIRQLARRAYGEWGFHVIAIDLRSWGQSSWTCEAPSSAGYYEGLDVVEIARALKRDSRVTSVGVMGFSLGGCTVLNAARHATKADDTPVDGGVLAVCAPSVVGEAIEFVSTRPHWRHPFFGMWVVFRTALRAGVRHMGLSPQLRTWSDLVRHHSAPWYGIDEHEFTRRASPANWAGEIGVPTLELHAADDFVVPVDHAWRLRDATADNDNVAVWVVDKGNHCAFTSVDRRWFFSVTRRWFEYWADEG